MLPGDIQPVFGGMALVACRVIVTGGGYIHMASQAGRPDAFEDTRNVTFHTLNGAVCPSQGIIGTGVLAAAGEGFNARGIPGRLQL